MHKVELVDFMYDVSKKQVDYQLYTFFQPMTGTEDEEITWKKNRKDAYAFSLMHFMRSVHADNFKKEGFEVFMIERKINNEKRRIQQLYQKQFDLLKDSLNQQELREASLGKMIERRFSRDSLRYYKKILQQEDVTQTIGGRPLVRDQFAQKKGDNVILNFSNYLAVSYKRKREPLEYFAYRRQDPTLASVSSIDPEQKREFAHTILYLVQNIPIEVTDTGYFNNIDLMMDGFWGWWEKLATKLPYDYTL